MFAPLSRALSIQVSGEAANATSLDEVADSAWFDNRIGVTPLSDAQRTLGACTPEDLLPDEVADGEWIVDHGKENGSTLGFRITVPGKGMYMLKADDTGIPERASAASVIGAALYNAVGFSTTCEQVVVIRRAQLTLLPGLATVSNAGISVPFDAAALDKVLKSSTQIGKRTRMQASKWLPGSAARPVPIRSARARRRPQRCDRARGSSRAARQPAVGGLDESLGRARAELDGSLWLAQRFQEAHAVVARLRASLHPRHERRDRRRDGYVGRDEFASGHAYIVSLADIAIDFVTLGAIERPWDRARPEPHREKFGLFSVRDFDPEHWKGMYPNPAMLRMTERDGAWMARIIARFTADDLHALAAMGRFADPLDADYLAEVLRERQHELLARYLTRLSPIADVHTVATDQLCAVDLARSSERARQLRITFTIGSSNAASGRRIELAATVGRRKRHGLHAPRCRSQRSCGWPRRISRSSESRDLRDPQRDRRRTARDPRLRPRLARGMFVVGFETGSGRRDLGARRREARLIAAAFVAGSPRRS